MFARMITVPSKLDRVAESIQLIEKVAPSSLTIRRSARLLLALGVMSLPAWAGDLSRYRNFQLGTDLPTVSKQVGVSPSQAKVIHRRPALIQELEWRPQPLGPSSQAEPVKEVAGAITPVPGGIGPMTITMLLQNTLQAARIQVINKGQ